MAKSFAFVFCMSLLLALAPSGRTDEPAPSTAGEISIPSNPAAESKAVPPRDAAVIEASIQRGIHFLLETQNKDGSWGSPDNTKGSDVYLPVPGGHLAVRAAVTAMCISALTEVGGDSAGVEQALDRAEAWLMDNLPHVRRANADALYNVWTHSYGISGLVHMAKRHADDSVRVERIKQLIREQMG